MEFQIDFRPFCLEDARFINNFRRVESAEHLIGGSKRPVAYERDLKWVQDIIMGDSQTVIYFAVTEMGKNEIIGYASISEIDYRGGSCFWSGIKLDANKAGKGWGTQVGLKILKYVFEELRMERCKGVCLEEHEGALRMMNKIGFTTEGLMRHSIFKNGRYNSQYLLSVIKEDYLRIKQERGL